MCHNLTYVTTFQCLTYLRTPDPDGAYTRAFNYHRMEITRSFQHPVQFSLLRQNSNSMHPRLTFNIQRTAWFRSHNSVTAIWGWEFGHRVLIVQCFCFCSGLTVYHAYAICKSCADIVREHFFTWLRMPRHSGYPLSAHRIVSFSVWANTPGLWASLLN